MLFLGQILANTLIVLYFSTMWGFFAPAAEGSEQHGGWKIWCLLHCTTPQGKGNARGISAPDKERILYFAALSQAAGVESFEESAGVLSDYLISLM